MRVPPFSGWAAAGALLHHCCTTVDHLNGQTASGRLGRLVVGRAHGASNASNAMELQRRRAYEHPVAPASDSRILKFH